jgi:hypothetical protein
VQRFNDSTVSVPISDVCEKKRELLDLSQGGYRIYGVGFPEKNEKPHPMKEGRYVLLPV